MGKMKTFSWRFVLPAFLLTGFFCLMFPRKLYAADTAEKRTVRVGYYTMSNFQEYDASSGEYRGYSYDYLQAIAQYAGWNYEFVPVSFDKGLTMLEDGELDLMNNVEKTDTLSEHLSFSTLASGESSTCLVVDADNSEVSYEDFDALSRLTVGLSYSDSVKNSAFIDYCKDNDCMPKIIYYHSWSHVLQGMNSGEVNAYLVSSLEASSMRTVARIGVHPYYLATTKGNSSLLQELNAAMNKMKTENPYLEEGLYQKYHSRTGNELTVISESEKEYIASEPSVKVAYSPQWYPVSYTDGSEIFDGAMKAVFRKIEENTGLKFSYVGYATNEEALAAFRNGEADVFAGFPYDFTWASENNAKITAPFLTLVIFNAYKAGTSGGSRMAVTEGGYRKYLTDEILKSPYSFESYPSEKECLDAVLDGSADFSLVDSYEMEYYSKRFAYQGLAYKATGISYSLSLAVKNSADSRLYTIINKAVTSIGSESIHQAFEDTSLSAKSLSLIDTLYANQRLAVVIFLILGFMLAAFLIGMLNSRQMKWKNAELKKAANAKSEFLSNMSHDMRTPLNGIIGYTGLARETADAAEKEEYLDKIKISGEFLLSLINDTLDISKIESGKFVLNPDIVSGKELIHNTVVPIQMTAKAKNIRFLVDTDRAPKGYLKIDAVNSQKVLLNLLSNAVKYTPEGGTVRLMIERVDPPVENKNCRIVVEDNGIGMDEEFQKKMFEPFTQEYTEEARNTQGTGLGLSIVRRIILLMGGTISVKSKKGEGTTFELLVPVEITEYKDRKPHSAGTADLRGKHVLLCEDNYMNTEIAKKLAESRGLRVDCAENGAKGAELFASSPEYYYSLILMDLRMPVMDGYDASKMIRKMQRPDASSVPILAMSADAFEDDVRKTREAGMNGHISKPVNNAVFFEALEKYCGGRMDE